MNGLEITILIVLGLAAIRGWRGGVVRAALSLVAALASLWVAGQVSPALGHTVHTVTDLRANAAGWASFLVIFFLLAAVSSLIVATITFPGKALPDSAIGSFAGLALGLYRGAIVGALLASAIPTIAGAKWHPSPPNGWVTGLVRSVAGPVIEQIVPAHPGMRGTFVVTVRRARAA